MASNVVAMWDDPSGKPKKRGGGGGGPPGGGEVPERPDLWESCPFVPVGKSGRLLHFFDSSGELVQMAASALSQHGDLLLLCGARSRWLLDNFPALDRESGGHWFNARMAAMAIIQRCCSLELFDPNEQRHRYGLWVIPGGYALHAGKIVVWHGEEKSRQRDAGFRDAGALWPRLPAKPLPAEPASAATGKALEAVLASWNWETPHGPSLMLGGMVVGMLGSVAPWRAHLCVVGASGCGKSTLLRSLAAGLCPLTTYKNHFTEPGLRQFLSETAAGVILDEAESDSGGETKLQRVIEMLRRASSGAGVQAVQGGDGQEAKTFTVSTSAILGCIWPPALTEQDASRITLLQLGKLQPGGPHSEQSIAAFAAEHGLALWGRAVASAARAVALYRLLKARLVEHFECSPRMADQLGILAAARWVMIADECDDPRGPLADDGIDEPLECVRGLVVREVDQLADSGPNLALQRLLATPLDMQGDKLTIGQALRKLRRAGDTIRKLGDSPLDIMDREARDKALAEWNKLTLLLEGHGVKWGTSPLRPTEAEPSPPLGLYVTVQEHPRLSRAFADTVFSGQRWGAALARLPNAKSSKQAGTVRMAGGKPRCCWVPSATLSELTE